MTGARSRQSKRLNPSPAPRAQTRTLMQFDSPNAGQQEKNQSWKPGPKRQILRSWKPGLQGRSGNQDHYLYLGMGSAASRRLITHLISHGHYGGLFPSERYWCPPSICRLAWPSADMDTNCDALNSSTISMLN